MPDDAPVDPEDPSSCLNFFGIDDDLDYIVKETNIYIYIYIYILNLKKQ